MQSNQTLFNKYAFLSKVYLFTMAVVLGYLLSTVWYPMIEQKKYVLYSLAILLAIGFAMLRFKRLILPMAHYHVVVCYIVICINASRSGGIAAPGLIWLLMCPLVSFLTISFTVSTAWLVAILLTVVSFYFFDPILVVSPFTGEKHWHLLANVFLFTIVYFILKTFRAKVTSRTVELLRVNKLLELHQQELEISKKELERQHKLLEQSRTDALARSRKLAYYLNQHLEITRMEEIHTGSFEYAIKSILQFLLKALEVDQVAIWQVDPDAGDFNLVDSSAHKNKVNVTVLKRQAISEAFELLESGAIVLTGNNMSASQQLISKLSSNPQATTSIIACPFFIAGQLAGFFLCTSNDHRWTEEEIIFVRAISDTIALAFKSQQRTMHLRQVEEKQRQAEEANEYLEQKVRERTAELKFLNSKLTEIAFTNAHIIRGPICRLAGLNNLLNISTDAAERTKLIELIGISIDELNQISTKTSKELNALNR